MQRKYPTKMFLFFTLMDFIFHHFYLFLPGILLCFAGIWFKSCLWIGLAILGIDIILSFYEQLKIRKVALTPSNNPDFNKIMDAFCGPEGLEGVKKVVDEQIEPLRPFTPVDKDHH